MLYFALANDGNMYNLCDCGDIEAAEESAADLGINAVWLADEKTAGEWADFIQHHIADNAEGTEGQDRKFYSDDQDRDSYEPSQ